MKKPKLTKRQSEILTEVSRGKTDKEIAAILAISTNTVGHHVSMILDRLGANSRSHAVAVFFKVKV